MVARGDNRQLAAILFDLDDTLCDYSAARATRLNIAFSLAIEHARTTTAVDLGQLIDESIAIHPHGVDHFEQVLARHGVSAPGAAQVAIDWYRSNRFYGLRLFPEAAAVVGAVRQRAVNGEARAIGVVTNGPAEVQRAKIELLAVDDFVDFAVISGEFGVEKPNPAIFAEALRRAGVAPEAALVVGDSLEFDIAGASGSGIRSVWVNPRRSRPPSGAPEPSYQIASLGDLPDLVSRIDAE